MGLQEYSLEEVKLHNTKDDLWIIVEGKVYDLSKWKHKHPGGAAILLDFAGTDATGTYSSVLEPTLRCFSVVPSQRSREAKSLHGRLPNWQCVQCARGVTCDPRVSSTEVRFRKARAV